MISALTASCSALAAGPLQQCQAWQGHRVAWQEGTRVGFLGQGVDCQHSPSTSFPPGVHFLPWPTQLLCPPRWDLCCPAGRWGDVCSSRVTQGGFEAGGAETCGACGCKKEAHVGPGALDILEAALAPRLCRHEKTREGLGRKVSVSFPLPGYVKLGIQWWGLHRETGHSSLLQSCSIPVPSTAD